MNSLIPNYEQLDQEEASNILLKFAYCLFISVFFIFSINRAVLILFFNLIINNGQAEEAINRLRGNTVLRIIERNPNSIFQTEEASEIRSETSQSL